MDNSTSIGRFSTAELQYVCMHRPNVVVSCPFSDILNYLVDDCGLDINQYGGSKILCQCASSPNLELAQLVLKQGVDPSDGMNAALLTVLILPPYPLSSPGLTRDLVHPTR